MKDHSQNPPRAANRLLRTFLRKELAEEVIGDLQERFDEDMETRRVFRSKLRYWYEVINYLRPFAIRKLKVQSYQPGIMLQSNLKTSWRNLVKRKGYSAINIGALALGIASFLFLAAYVNFHRSYESFHQKADNIFRVTLDLYRGDEYLMTDCEMYAPFGPMAKSTLPEVVDFVRMMNNDDTRVKVGEKQFLEELSYFADSSIFNIFTLEPVHGTFKHALSKPYQAVMTESAAKRYFGNADARNQTFESDGGVYVVTAVIKDLPTNTHLKFDFLLSHISLQARSNNRYNDENWNTGNNEFTYLLMEPGTDLNTFNDKLNKLSLNMKEKAGGDRFKAEYIKDIHLYSHKTFEPDTNSNANIVNALLVIAFFILALAWVNYINFSTAKALERAKEVGIRKVLGSLHRQLLVQFLTESFLINLAASILALIIVRLGLPYFQHVSGLLTLDFFNSDVFWYALAGITLAGVIFSGLYPAFALSSHKPVSVLKGKFKNSAEGQWIRKGLVVFQFSATTLLLIVLFTVFYQLKFLQSYDLGMNIQQALVLKAPDIDSLYSKRFSAFRNSLLEHPGVHQVAQSQSIPAASRNEVSTTQSIFRVGKDKSSGSFNYYHYGIDENFFDAYDMKMVAGHNFTAGIKNASMVIINEEASKSLGFSSPEEAVGSKISYYTDNGTDMDGSTVIGVIKNFNQWSPKDPQLPMIFRYSNFSSYITIQLETSQAREVIAFAEKQWKSTFAANPFSYFFQDDRYNEQYKIDEQLTQVIGTFAVLAIVIASLGLFGLSSYTALQRRKEIGIRKVLGGSVLQINKLLSVDFVRLVFFASVISAPLAYFVCNKYLETYSSRITLGAWIFIIPIVSVVMVALLTISIETLKAARANPTDVLRSE